MGPVARALAVEGRPDAGTAAYLSRWALLSEAGTAAALGVLRATGMALYVFSYLYGWQLLDTWLEGPDGPDRTAKVRRLLTEQLFPADPHPADPPVTAG